MAIYHGILTLENVGTAVNDRSILVALIPAVNDVKQNLGNLFPFNGN